jgi:cellulose synthase/poly-beta-1,6-N-acetylglucosamine synthase-like glycosyltransferase
MVIFLTLIIITLLIFITTEIIGITNTNRYKKTQTTEFDKSVISIIIPVRNEEAIIERALHSINLQEDDNFELILIVDRCTDKTLKMAQGFSEQARFNVKIIINTENPPVGQSPKVHLLEKGIQAACGDIYLYTDADCAVPADWITNYRELFSKNDTGLVMGSVEVETRKTLLSGYQNFEHIYRSFYAAVCVGVGIPTGGFGNNMAIRRSCYESLGGYANLPDSVTEDAVLVSSVGNSPEYKVRSIASTSKRVKTLPIKKFSPYLMQSLRWATGAVHSTDVKTKGYYNLLMALLTLSNLSLLLSPFFPQLILIPVLGFIYLLSSGIMAGIFMGADRNYWLLLTPSIFLFFFFFQISFILALTNRRIQWKGTVITAKG